MTSLLERRRLYCLLPTIALVLLTVGHVGFRRAASDEVVALQAKNDRLRADVLRQEALLEESNKRVAEVLDLNASLIREAAERERRLSGLVKENERTDSRAAIADARASEMFEVAKRLARSLDQSDKEKRLLLLAMWLTGSDSPLLKLVVSLKRYLSLVE